MAVQNKEQIISEYFFNIFSISSVRQVVSAAAADHVQGQIKGSEAKEKRKGTAASAQYRVQTLGL